MTILEAAAHAKINLTLDVLGKRADGYHDLRMVMQEIALGDRVRLTLGGGEWRVTADSGQVPQDESNLAMKAARLFFGEAGIDPGGLSIELSKVTPACAGLGGGSADGAAVLRLLWEHYGAPFSEARLYALAEQVGSDVPFALFGGTALAEEKGQRLRRLPPIPACAIVLCKPDFPVSTPELFRAVDGETALERPDTAGMLSALEQGDISAVAARLGNVFTPLIVRAHPEVEAIRQTMLSLGALGASMSGSGPTVFGLFSDETCAKHAFFALKGQYSDTFLTRPV